LLQILSRLIEYSVPFNEKFEDFKERDGLMLPSICGYEYSIEGQENSFLAHWTLKADGPFAHNGKIPDNFFMAQKESTVRLLPGRINEDECMDRRGLWH
jgi:hypothetical protein